jgi:hypothetical protein
MHSRIILLALLSSKAVAQGMESLKYEETFAAAHLPPAEAKQVTGQVELSAYDVPDSWDKELRARRIHLGDAEGLIVQGTRLLCGATGNCQIWVLRKSNGRWVSLFGKEQAPIASGFRFGPGSSHGIKDFRIITHLGGQRDSSARYRFDGKYYRATKDRTSADTRQ